ncbi:MAG: ATP-grasp domain-containing protein [Candidatus Krumholzibacteria bacterium]|nr:ATP-grasp domain-containing protein [Candidatus Krumholzibacteria bacterium]
MNIAIFNAEARKAVSVIRSLGEEGLKIISFSFERISFAGSSRYVHKNFYLKDFDTEYITKKLKSCEIDMILPIEDSSIEFFGKNKDRFKKYRIIMPEFETFILFADKANTVRLAKEKGVSVPETYIPDSTEEAEKNLLARSDYPLVIKPRRSTGSIGLKIVKDPKEGTRNYRMLSEKFHLPLIQQYIPQGGKALGAEFLFFRGREIMSFSHQRIREFPVNNGPSTFCKYYRKDDALTKGRKFFEGLNYSGFAMVEFKEHPETKELYLMEINPRPWGSITLPISMGFNFPAEAVKVFWDPENYEIQEPGLDIDLSQDYYMRWFLPGDLLSISLNKRMTVTEKFRKLFRKYKNTAYQILSLKDPLPALTMILKLALNLFNFGYIRKYLLRRW